MHCQLISCMGMGKLQYSLFYLIKLQQIPEDSLSRRIQSLEQQRYFAGPSRSQESGRGPELEVGVKTPCKGERGINCFPYSCCISATQFSTHLLFGFLFLCHVSAFEVFIYFILRCLCSVKLYNQSSACFPGWWAAFCSLLTLSHQPLPCMV